MSKSSTSKIVILEPDQEHLEQQLAGRDLSPDLHRFLTNLLKTKKWPRMINIPSGRDDLAAVLVFTTALKEDGLEILSELHVFFAGRIMVEKWVVLGETDRATRLPKEALSPIVIEKVRAQGEQVNVEIAASGPGEHIPISRSFDFSAEEPAVRIVPHPVLD